jgi:AAA+ ATPase superfamily predicted ATPase
MIKQPLIGRESEISVLQAALESPRAELIAIYGRRRVGKTFLIRTIYAQQLIFELMGLKDLSRYNILCYLLSIKAAFSPNKPQ